MTEVEVGEDVTVIGLDDGRVNAISPALVREIDGALDEALGATKAVVIAGRPGYLSAGFDLKVIRGEPAERDELLTAGRSLLLRLFELEVPVVVACTGHAIAAGAGLLVTADWRVGARGPFRLGFNEVAVGVTLSAPTMEMIRYRMTPTAFESVVRGDTFEPDEARSAGLLDEVVEPDEVEAVALGAAQRLAALSPESYATMKRRARRPAVEAIQRALRDEAG